MEVIQKVTDIVKPVIEGSGFKIYDLEMVGRYLRIYLQKEGGVSIDDCVEMTKLLGPLLDVEDVVPGNSYELEISSPGLERILKRPDHFKGAVGEKIWVKSLRPMSEWNGTDVYYLKRHKLTGVLEAVESNAILVKADNRVTKIPIEEVAKAQVLFEVQKGEKKGKKSHGS